MAGGYNAFTYQQEFLRLVTGKTPGLSTNEAIPDSFFYGCLNQGLQWIQDEFKLALARDGSTDLASGTDSYLMPYNRYGPVIRSVRVKRSDGTRSDALEFMRHDLFQELYNREGTATQTGTIRHWTVSASDPSKIIIGPKPDYSATDGIYFEYFPMPDPIWRIYNQSTITATFTINSATVTFSSAVTPRYCTVRDEVGMVETTNSDGTALAEGTINEWYPVNARGTSTTATFTDEFRNVLGGYSDGNVYSGDALAGKRFVSAQVSELEWQRPGLMRMAPAIAAAAFYFLGVNEEKSDRMMARARGLLAGMSLNTGPDETVTFPRRDQHAHLYKARY